MLMQVDSGFPRVVLVELDYSWWNDFSKKYPVVFMSDSPESAWCGLDDGLLRNLLLTEGHSFQVLDSVLVVFRGGRRIAVLPASVLLPLVCVSVYMGLDNIPYLSVWGKAFPIELTPTLYVDDDGRLGAPRGSFLAGWGPSDLLKIKVLADYWR